MVKYTGLKSSEYSSGYCTPGMIMATKALLDDNPTEEEMKKGLTVISVTATGYIKIIEAVLAVN